jgi:hypothetical protein
MATFTDDFTRADETPIAGDWETSANGGINLVAGQVQASSFNNISVLTGFDFEPTQSAEVEITAIGTNARVGCMVRADNAGNGYLMEYSEGDGRIYTRIVVAGSTGANLASGLATLAVGDIIRTSITGNVIKAFVNGSEIVSYTDSSNTYPTGVVGLYLHDTTIECDNFSATGLIPAAGTNYTVDFPDVTAFTADTVGLPFTSAAYQNELVVTDGTDTAAINIIREPKAGYTVVETISATNVKGSIFENRVSGAPFDGSQVYYSTAGNTTISATGIITTDLETLVADVWDVTTGIWEKVTFDAAVSRYTFDLPDVTTFTNPTAGLPFTSTAYQNEIVATDGTSTAAINIVHNPKEGYAVIDIVNATAVKGSIFETRIGGAPFDGSQICYSTANNTSIDATGIISTDSTELTAYVWDVTSKDWGVVTFDAVDETAPIITINPTQTTYNVIVGGSFTPPVGTSTDAVAGVKTITPTGSVNVNTAGAYTLTYSDTDAAGNVATPIVVTVNVSNAADVTAPVITVSGSVSQSIAFGSAVPTFTSSTDDGSTVVVGGDTVNNTLAGTYVITFDATDLAGNVATQVTRTVIVEAELDTTAPVITVSGNATTTIPFNDTAPTFTSSTDDGSTVVIGGDTVNTGVAGTYVITFNATDTSGNAATQVTRTVIVEAEVVSTTILNMTLTGTPDGSHDVRVINPAQMSDSFILAATFSGGSASLITPFSTPTALEYYVIGTTEGGLQRGTTE